MRKKTAPRTRKPSPSKQLGLIAREKNAMQSAVTKSALDNHFHRTALAISCERSTLAGEHIPQVLRYQRQALNHPAIHRARDLPSVS